MLGDRPKPIHPPAHTPHGPLEVIGLTAAIFAACFLFAIVRFWLQDDGDTEGEVAAAFIIGGLFATVALVTLLWETYRARNPRRPADAPGPIRGRRWKDLS
jgi:hypothetical protein